MDTEFIELNAFVKILNWASTGGQAKLLIRSGVIKVNGEIEQRNGKKLIASDVVEYLGQKYVVGQNVKMGI
ncbi:MAG: RNA-binding S4 domain-containing protein [Candidatus Woesearchaeota archaeon]